MKECPVDGCDYKSSEHGISVHRGVAHKPNTEICDNCGDEFSRPPSKVDRTENIFCSDGCKNEYRVGENNPNGTNSCLVTCSNCGEDNRRPKSEVNNGQDSYYCDKRCMVEHWRENGIQSGEDNPMYGGEGSSWRSRSEWLSVRDEVISEQEHCRRCGSSNNLHVHHIVPVFAGGAKYDKENLITLCQSCHHKVHKFIDSIYA